MKEIVPAIIGQSFKEIESKLAQVDGLTTWAQLDIMDGLFVPPYTWQAPDQLHEIDGKVKIEAHLMVESPEEIIPDWLLVADRIIFHLESTADVEAVFNLFTASPVKVGVALKLETPIEKVVPLLERVSLVQLMGIKEIGYHGHPFDSAVLDKIRDLRRAWPDGTISVDGGINLETAELCLEAGADNLVVGSAIWESGDIARTIQQFQDASARSKN